MFLQTVLPLALALSVDTDLENFEVDHCCCLIYLILFLLLLLAWELRSNCKRTVRRQMAWFDCNIWSSCFANWTDQWRVPYIRRGHAGVDVYISLSGLFHSTYRFTQSFAIRHNKKFFTARSESPSAFIRWYAFSNSCDCSCRLWV